MVPIPCKNRFIAFNGKEIHATNAWKAGTRYLMTYYHRSISVQETDIFAHLVELGFNPAHGSEYDDMADFGVDEEVEDDL